MQTMRILLVAPQPFYQERGSPIAVKLLIETLCCSGYSIDLLTYHEGQNQEVKGLRIFRIRPPAFVKNIPIGISWKKIVCDFFISLKLMHLLAKHDYGVVHAVEEAVFPALLLKSIFGFKLVYDMDSSMVEQLIDKYPQLKTLYKPMRFFEKLAVRGSDVVLPVCDSLAETITEYALHKRKFVLHDVPLISEIYAGSDVEDLRRSLGLTGTVVLYVGNLEHYQGIDLMVKAFTFMANRKDIHLVVIGGNEENIRKYKIAVAERGIDAQIHFIGPRPLSRLFDYLMQADILVSPRLSGQNTPMKIYSYLASGKPILATDIPSHNQILDNYCSIVVKPEPQAISKGLMRLAGNVDLCRRIGFAGKELVNTRYSCSEYRKKLLKAYATLKS